MRDREQLMDAAIVVAAGLLLFSLNVDFDVHGDSLTYADYVLRAQFSTITLHIGYYLLVFAADRTIGSLLGLPVHELMVWFNVVTGALTLGVAYLLARHFLGARRDAFLCVVVLGVCGRVLSNATSSEIYMVQTLLVWLSFYLFARERVVVSGVVAGLALLMSPLSAFAYLFFPVLDYQRAGRIRWKVLFTLAGAALVVYLPYLTVFGHELLWGERGLLRIHGDVAFAPMQMLANFPRYQFKHYTALLLLLIPALFALRREKRFLALSLAVGLPHLYVILKLTSEDNTFILNTDFFFACWIVIGWRELAASTVGRWLGPAALAAHVALMVYLGEIFTFDSHRGYADELRNIARTYIVGRDAVMVTDWDHAMDLTYFGRSAPTVLLELDPLIKQMYDIRDVWRLRRGNPEAAEIFLLDPWSPSAISRLLRSPEAIAEMEKRYSLVSQADRLLNLQCTLMAQTSNRLYRCVKR